MNLRTPAVLATTAALSLGAAACGSNESSSGSSSGSSSQSQAPKPVAQIDQLTGKSTAVTLDAGFVDALTQLKLTPSPTGDASISESGVASFPITGGDVKYFKPGSVSPYVQGEIDHDGSGLQLKGGGKTVRLTDFVIDPGASVLTGKVTDDGTAVLEGTTVKFKDESAQLLNDTFGVDALEGGLVVGVAKITVNTGA